MIVIDAKNLLVGRLASYAARKALMGEEVRIVNCENAFISGGKKYIIAKFTQKRARGTHSTGPFYPRYADKIIKRMIRGMLPYNNPRGKEAYKRVLCYVDMPAELSGEKAQTIESAQISKLPNMKYLELKTLSRYLGAKVE